MDGDVIEVKRGRPGLHGLQVLDGLQLRSRRLLVELEQQRRDDDGDRAQGHRGRAHPRLELEAPRGEEPGGQRDADQVVDGGEHEVEPDPSDGSPGEVQTPDHVQKVVLETKPGSINVSIGHKKSYTRITRLYLQVCK